MNINAIMMPLIRSEICELKSWIRHCPRSGEVGKTIYLAIDLAWTEADKIGILDTFSRSALHGENWNVRFIDCEMNPDDSFYQKESSVHVDLQKHPYGQKSGPNIQFFRMLRSLRRDSNSINAALLMEVDAFPLANDWLKFLQESAANAPTNTLVAGPRYMGESFLNEQIRSHLNGNSIYVIGNPDFYDFLDCWEAVLLKSIQVAPSLAYDVAVIWHANYGKKNEETKESGCDQAERAVHYQSTRTHDLSHVLINYGGAAENHPLYKFDVYCFFERFPKALIAHGKCFHSSVHALRSFRRNRPRRHQASAVVDCILTRDYEQSLLLGIRDGKLLRTISESVELISKNQRSLISREWSNY